MKRLYAIVLFCFLLAACLEKAGPAGRFEGAPIVPGDSNPMGASMQDTPPIAGPSDDQDKKPEIPVGECKEENGVHCPEKLEISRNPLCLRTSTALNPILTLSVSEIHTAKPMASDGQVTLRLWRYADVGGGSPGGSFATPTLDLAVSEVDLDASKSGVQLATAPDGSVTFHLVAGQKTGYYEFWIFGDRDTAYGDLTVESCEEAPGDTLAPGTTPPPSGPLFQAP